MHNKNFTLIYQNNTNSHLFATMYFKIKKLSDDNFLIKVPCYFYNAKNKILNRPYCFNPSAFKEFKYDKDQYESSFVVNCDGLMCFIINAIEIAKSNYKLQAVQF